MSLAKNLSLDEIESPLTTILNDGDPEQKREEIRRYFHSTFSTYEKLFEVLKSDEAYFTRADPLRHPLIFYWGHTAVFFINKLVLGKHLPERLDPFLERTCAVGVDEMSWDDLNEAHYEWPTVQTVTDYRNKVREVIDQLITDMPIDLPISWDSPFWIIMMGIEHERIHLETSSVLIRQLPLDQVQTHPAWPICTEDHDAPSNELIDVKGGMVKIGKDRNSGLYGWDNEYGLYESDVADFSAAKYLVSNREYLKFVEDGGYENKAFWTDEGWNWATYENRGMPRFWRKNDAGDYQLRCMLEEIPMPWSWPVETNYLEAKAFCNWKAEKIGKSVRLPTEEEWYRLLDVSKTPDVTEWDQAPGNINLEVAASSVPVDTFEFGGGFYDILGNVWQHTETPISGLPGFQVHPLYDDFSTPTFDTKHNIIKGGSWIATGNETTRDSRYAFRRHFYQHAGFRYFESDAPVVINDDRYETDPDVVPYCEQQYGPDALGLDNFSERIAQICLDRLGDRPRGKAMEIGCKTGRTCFELAVGFEKVTGFDPTARTIRIGVEMVDKGYTQWETPMEGELVEYRQQHLKDLGLEASRGKVEFLQADLSNMKSIYQGYDLILVNNLLERSYQPENFLKTVHERLNPRGLLVIACTNDWSTDCTEKEHWLGGYKDPTGESVFTRDTLQRILGDHFSEKSDPVDVPFTLRKTARKFEHYVSELTFWERK
ncbi:5-histidylcysteine sulfoxide synthase [Rubellicoccus peritrichatus]|uniref:5-histidylcysteine sulfoxide synthase n=1 Tax=Rubellicoccus peritrichatus TaxID=3080537 RepID=A0AAQ3L8F4_9BACT|nr:5-histidylcysteine sulfoxide synthase [Puniceicoccus sp. CR14]WOO41240.1 5-histidylcysteine sulfoxide synthase [Puniceicoccus sp. CR14]